MHVDNELVEFMTAGEQEYDEVIDEYEEEILMQEDVPEPPVTDFADTVPAEGKPRCITPILLQFKLYLCIKFKELNENHLHIYIYIYILILWVLLAWPYHVDCYATGLW